MAVRIRLDQSGIDQILNSPTGPVGRMVATTTKRVWNRARNNVNTDTGAMRAGIRSHVEIYRNRWQRGIVESTDPASMFVEKGTDGATKASGVFRFPDRGGSQRNSNNRGPWVYTRSFKGQPAQNFMWRALRDGTRGVTKWRVTRSG